MLDYINTTAGLFVSDADQRLVLGGVAEANEDLFIGPAEARASDEIEFTATQSNNLITDCFIDYAYILVDSQQTIRGVYDTASDFNWEFEGKIGRKTQGFRGNIEPGTYSFVLINLSDNQSLRGLIGSKVPKSTKAKKEKK